MAAMLLAGCGGAGSSSAAASASGSAAAGTSASAAGALDPNIKATLTFATYDNEAMDLYEEMDLEGRFQELYRNVNIEIEEFKDDDEYFNQMKKDLLEQKKCWKQEFLITQRLMQLWQCMCILVLLQMLYYVV